MKEIAGFTKEALDYLSSNEEKMKISMLNIQKYFSDMLLDQNIIVSGRVKSPNSLKEKILRKSFHVTYQHGQELIQKMDDIIGVRIICLLHSDEKQVWEKITTFFEEESKKENNKKENNKKENNEGIIYLANREKNIFLEKIALPVLQKNGHDIYKVHGYCCVDGEKLPFELQIKSLVHMLWGEIEHMLFYKNYEYNIDNSFYGSVMDSMYNNLMNIDSQLKNITNQMRDKNDQAMFEELKRMLAKLLSERINKSIETILECKIDLRECYDSVIEVLLHLSYYYTYKDCLGNVQKVVAKINEIDLNKLTESIPHYEYVNKIKRDKRKISISHIISEKSKKNIYYRLFVFLVGEMCNKQGAADVIETVTDYYLRIFNYEDDLEEEIGAKRVEFIKEVTDKYLTCIIEKFDFYWLILNKSYIMEVIRAEIDIVGRIVLDESDQTEKACVLLVDVLLLKTFLDNNQTVPISLLQDIYKQSDNDVWSKEELGNREFEELIEKYSIDEGEARIKLNKVLCSEEVGLCLSKN